MIQASKACGGLSSILLGTALSGLLLSAPLSAQETRGKTSYAPVNITEDFAKTMARMKADKPKVMARHKDLLNQRYDLANRAASGVTMSGGKAIQEGVRVKLPAGTSWDQLAAMKPEEIRQKDLWPAGFFPLPHPNHPACSSRSSTSRKSRSRKGATSRASIWTSTCPTTSCPSSRRRSI